MIKIPANIIREDKLKPPTKLRPSLLLMSNIPKPLSGLNPRTILGKVWWDKTRYKVYRRQGFCCLACGVHKKDALFHNWLEAHEVYEHYYSLGYIKFIEIVGLCHACHNFIHDGRMNNLCLKGEITYDKMQKIIHHGMEILRKDKLSLYAKEVNDYDLDIPWEKWYLLFRRKKYYSKFKGIEEWRRFYNV